MSTPHKRDISPPPVKRRRMDRPSALAPTLPARQLMPLGSDHLRIFTWNVNGIKPFLQQSITSFFQSSATRKRAASPARESSTVNHKSYSLRECLERWQWPHVVCLQEVKIANTDQATQKAVEQALKAPKGSSDPGYRAFFSLPRDKMNARGFGGKLYGVCTLVRADVIENNTGGEVRVEPVDWEQEGRVLSMTVPQHKLLVLNVYAVNGTDYPYKDSRGQEIGTRHDFKRKFHTLMQNMVRSYEDNDWSVVIAGDINIARDSQDGFPGIRLGEAHVQNRKDFHRKFMEYSSAGGLGMIDSFRHIHRLERKYTYRSLNVEWGSSCDRVDLILLTRNMIKNDGVLVEADILDSETERGSSDHLPSYVTLNLARLAKLVPARLDATPSQP